MRLLMLNHTKKPTTEEGGVLSQRGQLFEGAGDGEVENRSDAA